MVELLRAIRRGEKPDSPEARLLFPAAQRMARQLAVARAKLGLEDQARVPHQFDRWMYRGGRPNRLARFLNGIWRRAAIAGLPPRRQSTLEVRGRRTGKLRSFPVVVADYEGGRYLVAMLGENANWAANVRAARGHAVLRHGRREAVRLEEVDPASRAPILQRYLQLAPGARAHIPVDPHASRADFEMIARRYPVFRICPDSPPAR